MTALLGLVLKSLVIAGVTLILLRLTRGRSAAERSLIAHLGLAGLVILPLATLVLPSMRLPMPEFVQSGFEAPAARIASRPAASFTAAPVTADAPAMATPATETAAAQPWFTLPHGWERYAYALPVLALLLLTIVALLRLVRLRAGAEVLVDPVWLSALAHAQRRMGMKSGTALLVSDALPSPISWGLARPTILLSADALAATDEAEAIIAHELAHVSALDWAKLMLARVATAIHWFNPLAWRLAREAHQLREEAADDAVLAANIDAPDYAQLLVRVARHESKGLLLGAHGVAPGKGSLKRRVGRVLDATLPRGRAQGSWIAGFGAGMLVMVAPLAALTVGAAESRDATTTGRESKAGTGLAASPVTAPTMSPAAHAAPAPAATEHAPAVAAATPAPVAAAAAPDPRQDREARSDNGRDRELNAIIGARAVGVTPEYIEAIRRAAPQLGPISLDDATSMRAVGVTPEYVQAMMSTGLRIRSFDDIVSARAVGVNPDYVRSLVSAGFRGQLDDYVALAGMGVSADDVRRLRNAGMPVEIDTLALTRNGRKRGPNPNPNPRPNPNPHPDPDPNPDN